MDVPDSALDLQSDSWKRMPKPKQRLCGLSRTTLLELSQAGKIRTVHIRKPGRIRGIRIVYMPSLVAYFETQMLNGKEVGNGHVR